MTRRRRPAPYVIRVRTMTTKQVLRAHGIDVQHEIHHPAAVTVAVTPDPRMEHHDRWTVDERLAWHADLAGKIAIAVLDCARPVAVMAAECRDCIRLGPDFTPTLRCGIWSTGVDYVGAEQWVAYITTPGASHAKRAARLVRDALRRVDEVSAGRTGDA